MDNEEYLNTQYQLVLQAQLINQLDLDVFLAAIEHAEAVAPIIAPTLFIQGAGKLEEVKRLAQAAKRFQTEVRRQIEEGKTLIGCDMASTEQEFLSSEPFKTDLAGFIINSLIRKQTALTMKKIEALVLREEESEEVKLPAPPSKPYRFF